MKFAFHNNYAQGPGNLTRTFEHDPLYRLLSATGRESTGVLPQPTWDQNIRPEDHTKTNTYKRSYVYDMLGNIQELKHIANGHSANNFTRGFKYGSSFTDNQLQTLVIGSNSYNYKYDPCGNVTQENTDRYPEWDFANKMRFFKIQAGAGTPSIATQYFDDATGNRVKKITNPVILAERSETGLTSF